MSMPTVILDTCGQDYLKKFIQRELLRCKQEDLQVSDEMKDFLHWLSDFWMDYYWTIRVAELLLSFHGKLVEISREDILKTSIEELDFTYRAKDFLGDIFLRSPTVGEVIVYSEDELMRKTNCTKEVLDDIKSALRSLGLSILGSTISDSKGKLLSKGKKPSNRKKSKPINWADGMPPSELNAISRRLMARLAVGPEGPHLATGIKPVTTPTEQMLSPAQVAKLLGCGRTRLYQLMNTKQLRALKDGGRTRIPSSAVIEYQKSLPAWEPPSKRAAN